MNKCIKSRKVGLLFEYQVSNEIKANLLNHMKICTECKLAHSDYKSYLSFVERHIPKFELGKEQMETLLSEICEVVEGQLHRENFHQSKIKRSFLRLLSIGHQRLAAFQFIFIFSFIIYIIMS